MDNDTGQSSKKNLVLDIFSQVAGHYDLMNDLMSLGVHRLWKEEFCKEIVNYSSSILDVASGTGDIAFRIINNARKRNQLPHITLCDINQNMLNVARQKGIDANLFKNLDYVVADAEKLPFPDNSFDYYTIAFGIRNCSNINLVLQEAFRVLKPFGKFICLEFSAVDNHLLKQIYDTYSYKVIPKIGKIVARNEPAYQYLVDSIRAFPDQTTFKNMINNSGLSKAKYKNLLCGVAAIHTAYKL